MSKLTLRTFWILTLFATGVIAGCSGQASAPPNPTIASTLVTAFHDSGVGCNYTETGSNIGLVNGNIYTAPPPPAGACLEDGTATTFDIATQAACDANIAFLDLNAASRPGGTDPGAGQLATLTLPPGIYKAAGGTFLITGGDLTLEAQGDTSAVWEFQTASSFTVGAAGVPRNVLLINGAQARTCSGKWAAPPPSIPRAAAPWSARSSRPWASRSPRRVTQRSAH